MQWLLNRNPMRDRFLILAIQSQAGVEDLSDRLHSSQKTLPSKNDRGQTSDAWGVTLDLAGINDRKIGGRKMVANSPGTDLKGSSGLCPHWGSPMRDRFLILAIQSQAGVEDLSDRLHSSQKTLPSKNDRGQTSGAWGVTLDLAGINDRKIGGRKMVANSPGTDLKRSSGLCPHWGWRTLFAA
ncbi:hypothetical protein NHH03_03725 [Stieleria sp. TO1_6]|uniref:hypothetical protein n=1 Tax=Stieleria tagensis TaxID=2956795 RepID=UPI00209A93B3|nr:hypothetical protein [Stieleria tagensis]MCO8120834.1 hypothetical protein [Stieleria tagensis]